MRVSVVKANKGLVELSPFKLIAKQLYGYNLDKLELSVNRPVSHVTDLFINSAVRVRSSALLYVNYLQSLTELLQLTSVVFIH